MFIATYSHLCCCWWCCCWKIIRNLPKLFDLDIGQKTSSIFPGWTNSFSTETVIKNTQQKLTHDPFFDGWFDIVLSDNLSPACNPLFLQVSQATAGDEKQTDAGTDKLTWAGSLSTPPQYYPLQAWGLINGKLRWMICSGSQLPVFWHLQTNFVSQGYELIDNLPLTTLLKFKIDIPKIGMFERRYIFQKPSFWGIYVKFREYIWVSFWFYLSLCFGRP